jgi:hypothetical protein
MGHPIRSEGDPMTDERNRRATPIAPGTRCSCDVDPPLKCPVHRVLVPLLAVAKEAASIHEMRNGELDGVLRTHRAVAALEAAHPTWREWIVGPRAAGPDLESSARLVVTRRESVSAGPARAAIDTGANRSAGE